MRVTGALLFFLVPAGHPLWLAGKSHGAIDRKMMGKSIGNELRILQEATVDDRRVAEYFPIFFDHAAEPRKPHRLYINLQISCRHALMMSCPSDGTVGQRHPAPISDG